MKRIALLALASAFLLSVMIVTSSAQERRVGVTKGDWFKYGIIDISWNFIDFNVTFPPFGDERFKKMSAMEWMLLSVEDIYGTNITFQITEHYKDGTEKTFGGYIDVDMGIGENTSMAIFMAISADLNVNDAIYTYYPGWKINETIVRTYTDSARYTNRLHVPWMMMSFFGNQCTYETNDFYWDKTTGILVERSFEGIYYQNSEPLVTWSGLLRITESNVWVLVPEFPTWTPMLLTLIVLTVAIVIYKRRLLKTTIH